MSHTGQASSSRVDSIAEVAAVRNASSIAMAASVAASSCFSAFSRPFCFPRTPFNSAIFGRYDWFEWDTDDGEQETTRLIAGLAYYFYGDCAFVLDYDRLFSSEGEESDDWSVKLTMQVYLH